MRLKGLREGRDDTLDGGVAPLESTILFFQERRGMRILALPRFKGELFMRHAISKARVTPSAALEQLDTPATPPAVFACLWIADVPTWALERLEPDLRGQAVIATDAGRVCGANTVARRSGVRIGDSLGRARGLCETAVVRPLEPGALEGVLDDALAHLNSFTPWLERVGSNTIYATGPSLEDAARVAAELGVRVGISASRGAALLAALAARENAVRLEADQSVFLDIVPLRLLRGAGISVDTLERLALFGIGTLGELRVRVSKAQLERQFPTDHARLWSLAHGDDLQPVAVYTPPKCVTARLELESAALEPSELHPALEQLVGDAISKLGRHLVGALTLRLETEAERRSSRVHLRDFTCDTKTLLRSAKRALLEAQGGHAVTTLELVLSDLSKPIPRQDNLFAILERPGVREAVQRVHRRFPARLGRLKITNSRAYLPERRFRFQALTGDERSKRGKR